jgi:putative membrane protein insertion efficiency factor
MFAQSISGSGRRIKRALHFMKKRTTHELIKEGLIILIHLYRHTFSTFLGPCCRFTPSCSSYALLSVQRFGIIEGAWLIFKRLIKCHPFHSGGYDPVPEIIKKY